MDKILSSSSENKQNYWILLDLSNWILYSNIVEILSYHLNVKLLYKYDFNFFSFKIWNLHFFFFGMTHVCLPMAEFFPAFCDKPHMYQISFCKIIFNSHTEYSILFFSCASLISCIHSYSIFGHSDTVWSLNV